MTKEKMEIAVELQRQINNMIEILESVTQNIENLAFEKSEFHLTIQTKSKNNWSNKMGFIRDFVSPTELLMIYKMKIQNRLTELQKQFEEL